MRLNSVVGKKVLKHVLYALWKEKIGYRRKVNRRQGYNDIWDWIIKFVDAMYLCIDWDSL